MSATCASRTRTCTKPLTEEQQSTLIEVEKLDKGRASFYRTLASLYFEEVTQEQIEAMSKRDFTGLDGGVALIAEGYDDIAHALRRIDSGTREKLACDFARVFLSAGNYEERVAPPYESVFTSEAGLLMQDARDEVYKAFCAEHLGPDESLHVPEDHLSFEFEFMAHLIERRDSALLNGDWAEAYRLAMEEHDFHRDHLLNWIDDFCAAVDTVALTRFYRGLAKVTKGYVHEDAETIDDILAVISDLAGKPRD